MTMAKLTTRPPAMSNTDELLSQFIDAWNAGERPRAEDYLDKASDTERTELAEMLHTFLEHAPPPNYSEETFAAIMREPAVLAAANLIDQETWPGLLPSLRQRAKLKRDEVVARLAEALELAGKEAKVKGYYHQMESGTLDPSGVSRKVIEALGKVFGVDPGKIERAGGFEFSAFSVAEVHLRADMDDMEKLDRMEHAAMAAPAPQVEMDEVDRLFRGGR
jgi:hypothetical protein